MVVASPTASFSLPEAYAAAGGLPRIMRICGLQIGLEIAMTGRRLSAEEALCFNLVNKISKLRDSVVQEALEMAKLVARLSPDAVILIRAALREAWEEGSVERAATLTEQRYSHA